MPFSILVDGARLVANGSGSWKQLFYLGDLDQEVGRFIRNTITPTDVVFDIGASFGICSIPMAKRARKVYSFEALKPNYELLVENLKRNEITNVVPVFSAVAAQTGTIKAPAGNPGNYSLASIASQFVEIPSVALDDFADQHGIRQIDFLKADIEGSETQALRGAAGLLKRRAIRKILVEFNPYWLERMGSNEKELYSLFEKYQLNVFRLTRLGNARLTTKRDVLARSKDPEAYFDVVLPPK